MTYLEWISPTLSSNIILGSLIHRNGTYHPRNLLWRWSTLEVFGTCSCHHGSEAQLCNTADLPLGSHCCQGLHRLFLDAHRTQPILQKDPVWDHCLLNHLYHRMLYHAHTTVHKSGSPLEPRCQRHMLAPNYLESFGLPKFRLVKSRRVPRKRKC